MKFIHCADLHLDSKMETLPSEKSKIRREEVLSTFERLCSYATAKGVSAVIIAGDMFDTARVTVKTRARVLHAISSNPSVDFLYLSGNHDDDNFIAGLECLPKNLKVFSDDWQSFYYDGVCISGIKFTPYNESTVYDGLSLDENKVNIVTLHGQIAGYVSADKDAEVISLPRLKEKYIDYLALGHIHQYSQGKLDNRATYAYSGCLDGRGFDETGDKGFVEISVENGVLTTEFIKFCSRTLNVFEYNLKNKKDWAIVRSEILTALNSNVNETSLIKVVIKGERKPDFEIDVLGLSIRLNELYFFAKVYDKTTVTVDENDYINDKSVRGEFVRAVWESSLSPEMKSKVITCGLSALKGEEL